MNYLFIILDSCRFDLFKKVYPQTNFLRRLGPAHKAYSYSNVTPASFVLMFGHAFFPYPRPRDFPWKTKTLNFIQKFPQHHKVLVTGMPWLSPKHDSVSGLFRRFNDVDFHDVEQVCKYGVEKFNKLSRKDKLFYVLWTGETHLMYEVGDNKTRWHGEAVKAYNRDKGELPVDYLDYLKTRQRSMILYCDKQLSKLQFKHPTTVIVTADHGDSIGENHRVGHANDCHPIQFTVPLQYKVIHEV